jgi:metallophosphoesterase (TIGR00282 family)
MRILYVGDVVGRPGRAATFAQLPGLRQRLGLDVAVVNCENAAGGKGVTPEIADTFFRAGADVLTSGNHVWQYRDIASYLETHPRLIRPANYPRAPGRGSYRLELDDGRTLGVIQVEGRVFMRNLECPFAAAEEELSRMGGVTASLIDIHCEATSEKQALGWHFAGRASAVIGTHTHVQTADERILPGGTAFITDVGMTGPHDSVIGMQTQAAIDRFLTQRTRGHQVATDNVILCGVVIEIDDASGRATAIERVQERLSN